MEPCWSSYDGSSGDKSFLLSNGALSPSSDSPNSATKTNWPGLHAYHHNPNCFSTSNATGGGGVIDVLRIADFEPSHSSCSRDSSLIDLKLGRFGDSSRLMNYDAPGGVLVGEASTTPAAKRAKASSGLNSHSPVCQVYGCSKDLSSSKDYHKRHRVCDPHSKTPTVVVNGLEQRFCQQCSRFHLLGEFDDGKRSCRRRLAGHNERRRKPQLRPGRLFHSYHGFGGARPTGTTVTATSFVCRDILPTLTGPSHLENRGLVVDSCSKHIKLEHGVGVASKLGSSWVDDGQFMQRPGCPYSEGLSSSIMAANVFSENGFKEYHHPQGNVSCPLFHNSLFDTASTAQGFPELSTKSGCALSLLSSHPQTSTGYHHNFEVSEVSEDPFGVGSLDLSNGVSHQLNSGALGNGNATYSGGFLDGSEYLNVRGGPSYDDGATIDLLQLSTQLQRVEHQRQAVSVKQEDDTFCCLRIT